jgi:hypothetical protein
VASASYEEGTVSGFISDSPLAHGPVRIGDEAIARQDDAKLRITSRRIISSTGPAATWALTASLP